MLRSDVGVRIGRVGVVINPLEDDDDRQVAKDKEQKNQLWKKLQKELGISPLKDFVPGAQSHAKDHVNQAKDQRDFHFIRVQKDDLVGRRLPNRIDAKDIRVAFVLTKVSRIQHERALKAVHGGIAWPQLNIIGPVASKDVDRFAKDVVVNEAGVDAKKAHHGDDVAAAEKDVENLILGRGFSQRILFEDQKQPDYKEDKAMPGVAEHHGKQEGKGGDGVHGRVHLPVGVGAVGVDQVLIKKTKSR